MSPPSGMLLGNSAFAWPHMASLHRPCCEMDARTSRSVNCTGLVQPFQLPGLVGMSCW